MDISVVQQGLHDFLANRQELSFALRWYKLHSCLKGSFYSHCTLLRNWPAFLFVEHMILRTELGLFFLP